MVSNQIGASFEALQKEAQHSYVVYLECSGVLDHQNIKVSLLKWPDVASSAIACINNPIADNYDVLLSDLKSVTVEPVRLIHEAVCERFLQIFGKDPRQCEFYGSERTPAGIVRLKNYYINKINLVFNKLSEITNDEYPSINIKQ